MPYRPYINQIRLALDKLGTNKELIAHIIGDNQPNLNEISKEISPGDKDAIFELLTGLLWFLYHGNLDPVYQICNRQDISGVERSELAEIAFDLCVFNANSESQYILASNFFFDERRMTIGILNYVDKCFNELNMKEAATVMQKFRSKLLREPLQQMGSRLFKESLAFESDQEQRDYSRAKEIFTIFGLDLPSIESMIVQQYEYQMNKQHYIASADLALSFNLGAFKIKDAAYKAFEEVLPQFRTKLESGLYRANERLSQDDPYTILSKIIKDYTLVSEPALLDPTGKHYCQKIQDSGFFLLKKLAKDISPDPHEFFTVLFTSANLIQDFNLDSISNISRAEEVDQIIGQIVQQLDKLLQEESLAPTYYRSLIKLFSFFSSYKLTISRIALRLFTFLINDNRITEAHELHKSFEFKDEDIKDLLSNRILNLLKIKKIEVFKQLLDTFNLVPFVKQNNEFLNRIYVQLDEYIQNMELAPVKIIIDTFNLPSRRIVDSSRMIIRDFLVAGKDNDAIKLMNAFDIRTNQIMPTLLEIYLLRVEKDWRKGYLFRTTFQLSILDIGIFKWLIFEILRIDRIQTWYMGKEIEPSKPTQEPDSTQQKPEDSNNKL